MWYLPEKCPTPFSSIFEPAIKYGFPVNSREPSILVSAVESAACAFAIACFLSEHRTVIFKVSPFLTFSFRAVALTTFFFLGLKYET